MNGMRPAASRFQMPYLNATTFSDARVVDSGGQPSRIHIIARTAIDFDGPWGFVRTVRASKLKVAMSRIGQLSLTKRRHFDHSLAARFVVARIHTHIDLTFFHGHNLELQKFSNRWITIDPTAV